MAASSTDQENTNRIDIFQIQSNADHPVPRKPLSIVDDKDERIETLSSEGQIDRHLSFKPPIEV